ncbi:hypothetical protein BTUL_0104g00120 [Botrytis tulipae]|uniref:Uncharacterized protein n=1 Tax=Botrytis tulipae TaxID=87230 RepID=A0A4Z1ERS1_9HELO|nr:hypothetical protein BTUL_0104g00120 [Botrytis tulipae]
MSSYSGSNTSQTHSGSGAGSDQMFFRVGSSRASSRSGSSQASTRSGSSRASSGSSSSHSSVSTNPSRVFFNSGSSSSSVSSNSSRTSGSSVSSQMSYGSNSSGRSSNSGSVQSTADKWEPYIDTRAYAHRGHNKLGRPGPRLGEDPLVTAHADKTSDRMERKAKAERKIQSEMRKKGDFNTFIFKTNHNIHLSIASEPEPTSDQYQNNSKVNIQADIKQRIPSLQPTSDKLQIQSSTVKFQLKDIFQNKPAKGRLENPASRRRKSSYPGTQ